MRICPSCGTELGSDEALCPTCGLSLALDCYEDEIQDDFLDDLEDLEAEI